MKNQSNGNPGKWFLFCLSVGDKDNNKNKITFDNKVGNSFYLSVRKHFWLKPVLWNLYFRYRTSALDEEIVGVMAEHFGVSRQAEAEKLLKWGYETHTATYLVLLNR